MADLIETEDYPVGIYQIETTDPVLGGTPNLVTKAGLANIPAQQLANRSGWLKRRIEGIELGLSGVSVVADNTSLNVLSVSCHVSAAQGALVPPLAIGGLIRHVEYSGGIAVQIADRYSPAGVFLSRYIRRRVANIWGEFAPVGPRVGSTILLSRSTCPNSLLKKNGALLGRITFADLFAEIGTTWGAGDGSITFALPDDRSEFLRGWDDGRGVDAGRVFGSAQGHALENHVHSSPANHTYALAGTGGVGNNGTAQGLTPTGEGFGALWGIMKDTLGASGASISSETRPRNITQLSCIQF